MHRNNCRVPPRPIVLISNIYYRVFCLILTCQKLSQTMRFFSRNCEIGFCSYMQRHFVHIRIELCLPFCSLGVHILLLVMGNETRASDILCTRSTTQLSPDFHIVLSQIIFLFPCFTSLQCFYYNFRNIFTIFFPPDFVLFLRCTHFIFCILPTFMYMHHMCALPTKVRYRIPQYQNKEN